MAKAGRQGMARPLKQNSRQMKRPAQALQQKHSRQMKRPAQALQQKLPADEVAGTGLVVNSRQMKLASLLPCNEEVGGESTVVLSTRKAGSDLTYCLPPNLSPLPVSVHTHSLNLQKPI